MKEIELKAWIASWRNLGPLREIPDLEREMATVASTMSDSDADVVAAVLITLAREGDRKALGALLDLLEFFSSSYPRAFGAALLARLESGGPPELVEQIGATDHPNSVKCLRARLDLQNASEELLIALASTLGELHGDDAGTLLDELAARESLPTSVRDEISIARQIRQGRR